MPCAILPSGVGLTGRESCGSSIQPRGSFIPISILVHRSSPSAREDLPRACTFLFRIWLRYVGLVTAFSAIFARVYRVWSNSRLARLRAFSSSILMNILYRCANLGGISLWPLLCYKPVAMLAIMNLHDIYEEGGFSSLKALGEAVGADPRYLHQCATGWRGKKPSPTLAAKLIAADPRISWEDLYRPLSSAARDSVSSGMAAQGAA